MWHSFDDPDEMAAFLSGHGYPVRVDPVDGPFTAQHRSQIDLLPGVALRHLATTGLRLTRTARMAAAGADTDQILIAIKVTGTSRVSMGDDRHEMSAGTALVMPLSSPSVSTFGRGESIALCLDRAVFSSALDGDTPAMPVVSGPLVSVLASVLSSVAGQAGSMSGQERQVAGATALDLLDAAIRSARSGSEQRPFERRALLETITADIRHRLADRSLSAQDLAQRHHISLRYLHSLFEDIGVPPAAYIRHHRLTTARRLLLLPTSDSIASVAQRCGFANTSSFVRAFRRQFDTTPGAYRQAAATTTTDEPPR